MRALRLILSVLGGLVLLVAAGIAGGLIYANSGAGHRFIAQKASEGSGGLVRIDGLDGHFPDSLRLDHAELLDKQGVWATLDGLALDWSPLKLLGGTASVQLLSAKHVQILRQPVPDDGASSGGGNLPVGIVLDKLQIDRLDLAEAVAGAPASLTVAGAATIASLERGSAEINVKSLDGKGEYHIHGGYGRGGADLEVTAAEPAQGLMARLADLPDLGALHLDLSLKGPREAEALVFKADAGAMHGGGQGKIDLKNNRLDLDISAQAPAMTPRPDLAWRSVTLDGHVHGSFAKPDADAHLTVEGVTSGDMGVEKIEAELHGNSGKADLDAHLSGVRAPGLPANLLGTRPVDVTASVLIDSAKHPIDFTIKHPLLSLTGKATLPDVTANLEVPDLAPFSGLAGTKLHGRATASAKLSGKSQVSLEAEAEGARLTAGGSADTAALDLRWSVNSSDLAKLGAPVAGSLSAKGTVKGPAANFQATATADGEIEAGGMPKEAVSLTLEASGLPNRPTGKIDAHGKLAGAPLALLAKAEQGKDGVIRIAIDQAKWKSVEAGGSLVLTDQPSGKLQAKLGDLDDFSVFTGTPMKGSADVGLEMVGNQAKILANAAQLDWGAGKLGHLSVEGTVDDPMKQPSVALTAQLDGLEADGLSEKASVQANGPMSALKVKIAADGTAKLTAEALLSVPKSSVQVTSLQAGYDGKTAKLQQPVTVTYGDRVKIAGLKAMVAGAEIIADGQVAPTLMLDVHAKSSDLSLIQGRGSVTLDAHLQGSTEAPSGDVHLAGQDLRWQGAPAMTLEAKAHLDNGLAHIDATLDSGKSGSLTITGTAPVQPEGQLDLRAKGGIDLAILDPMLAAEGRQTRGKVTLDGGVKGRADAPQFTGSAQLDGVSFRDFTQGVRLIDITGSVQTDGTAIRLDGVKGKAGDGEFTLSGRIDALAPGMPVDLTMTGRNIQPLSSDLLTANMDTDITIKGTVSEKLTVGGKVLVHKAEINIPDSLPPSVATLKVKKKGDAPPPPETPGMALSLDLAINAPQQIFVRGRGIDAEMGGKLQVSGTADDPQVGGGFDLRQGTFALAGQTLTITKGRIGFDGRGPEGKLDPTLDITCESNSNGIDATLTITGYADHPTIKLSSSPDLPQDEILAHLLFNSSTSQLSPLQIASIAEALATMSGAGGGFDPLATMRKTLGIDRLSVSSSNSGPGTNSNTTVEAGKYVAKGVYVGTKQGMSGGTQARVQIDLTKHLKLDTTLGTGGGTPATGATIDNDPGSSIGLTYQFEYK